jgi:hypothetical protein
VPSLRTSPLPETLLLPLAVAVVVLAALVVATELWLRHRGVQRAADRLADAMGAAVELRVVGRPLLRHMVRRHLPAATIVATDVPLRDGQATLNRLQVDLADLRVTGGPGEEHRLTADAGRFQARLLTAELLALVELPPYLVGMSLRPRGLRLQTIGGVYVDAVVDVDPTSLTIRPVTSVLRLLPQSGFRIPLPALPFGATIEAIELHDGRVEASGTLDHDRLWIRLES